MERLKNAWADVLVPQLLAEELETAARGHLIDDGYLRARVEVTLDSSQPGIMRATVHVTSGFRTTDPAARLRREPGNRPTTALQKLAVEQRCRRRSGRIPRRCSRRSPPNMRSRGYLAATLIGGRPRVRGRSRGAPHPHRRRAARPGRDASSGRRVGRAAGRRTGGARPGDRFAIREGAERPARARLERHYRDLGYREARVEATARVAPQDGRVATDVHRDGRSAVHRPQRSASKGHGATNDALVDRAITINAGRGGRADRMPPRRNGGCTASALFARPTVRFEPVPSAPASERRGRSMR